MDMVDRGLISIGSKAFAENPRVKCKIQKCFCIHNSGNQESDVLDNAGETSNAEVMSPS